MTGNSNSNGDGNGSSGSGPMQALAANRLGLVVKERSEVGNLSQHVLAPPSALSDDVIAALARPPLVARIPTVLRGCTGPVVDMCFLAGYVHPTVLVLLDGPIGPQGPARITAYRANRLVAALQLSGYGPMQGLSLLWQVDGLPHDATRVAACP